MARCGRGVGWAAAGRWLLALLLLAGCGGEEAERERLCSELGGGKGDCRAVLPAADATRALQRALLEVPEGGTVVLGAGTYGVAETLGLTTGGVTLRGAGAGETVLDFSQQRPGSGGDGLLVKAVSGFALEHLSVRDTLGDGVRVEKSRDVVLRHLDVRWTRGSSSENGLYGLYPIGCEDVLVEDSEVRGAGDGGIYLGESERAVLRRNRAHGNVVGIQVENSYDVDVYDNVAEGNATGIAFFNVPGKLIRQGGRRLRAWDNRVVANNLDNFSWSFFPAGVGVLVIAAQDVEIRGNEIAGHRTVDAAVLSYLSIGEPYDDPGFLTDSQRVQLRGNDFGAPGPAASGEPDTSRAVGRLVRLNFPEGAPDVVFDGVVDHPIDEAPVGNPAWICLDEEPGTTFVALEHDPRAESLAPALRQGELEPYACSLPPLEEVELGGVAGKAHAGPPPGVARAPRS